MVVRWAQKWNRTRQRQRDADLIASSPLFDRDWYLALNPDAIAGGLSAAEHYLLFGVAYNCNPGPDFDNSAYLRRYPDVAEAGLNPLVHYIRHGAQEGRTALTEDEGAVSIDQLLRERLKILRPLRAYTVPADPRRRVTLLTDSVRRGSLFGGVGTAIMFAALLAERLDASLRIATQTEPADAANVATVLQANSIPWRDNIDFVFTGRESAHDREIDLREGDLFLTTSWWTTANALSVLPPNQVTYLLQEDERMFYPHGDEHLRCCELLDTPGLRVVVNSQLLHAHFLASGLAAITADTPWFEPAFPQLSTVPAKPRKSREKQVFLFYARPWNGRNLFVRGLEAIAAALEQDLLDPAEWEFCFVGRDLVEVSLPNGVKPTIYQSLPWSEYRDLVARVDLGLTLMYTPHPSYPPLDLAAAGAVVVTNRFANKTSLAAYSPNIFCAEPAVDTLVAALGEAAELAIDLPRRRANQARNTLGQSWQENFAPVLNRLARELG